MPAVANTVPNRDQGPHGVTAVEGGALERVQSNKNRLREAPADDEVQIGNAAMSKQLVVELTDEVYAAIQREAARHQTSPAEQAAQALHAHYSAANGEHATVAATAE